MLLFVFLFFMHIWKTGVQKNHNSQFVSLPLVSFIMSHSYEKPSRGKKPSHGKTSKRQKTDYPPLALTSTSTSTSTLTSSTSTSTSTSVSTAVSVIDPAPVDLTYLLILNLFDSKEYKSHPAAKSLMGGLEELVRKNMLPKGFSVNTPHEKATLLNALVLNGLSLNLIIYGEKGTSPPNAVFKALEAEDGRKKLAAKTPSND